MHTSGDHDWTGRLGPCFGNVGIHSRATHFTWLTCTTPMGHEWVAGQRVVGPAEALRPEPARKREVRIRGNAVEQRCRKLCAGLNSLLQQDR